MWEASPDASFWVTVVAFVVVGAAAVWAYSACHVLRPNRNP